jgi:hypothetical protein
VTTIFRTNPTQFSDNEFAARSPATLIDWNALELDESVRLAVIDSPAEGPQTSTFSLLRGEPSWSHLYAE